MNHKKLLCQRHPFFYYLSVWEKRLKRYIQWYLGGTRYCKSPRIPGIFPFRQHVPAAGEVLPIRIKGHQSLLMRKLGDTDMQLQLNKVRNLMLAIPKVDGVLIHPGETFSLCKLLGNATKRKGYLEGLLLSGGEVKRGVGGGMCQLSNLIYWMVLHTPLTVTERHHHSFDPFPDDRRALPFGSGASLFYNYLDLQFRNDTTHTFQVKVWLAEETIKGEIRCDQELPYSYHVFEKDHAFILQEGRFYRKNQIWRRVVDRETGETVEDELLAKNFAEVKYTPAEFAEDAEVLQKAADTSFK